jgi:hypothetical protein
MKRKGRGRVSLGDVSGMGGQAFKGGWGTDHGVLESERRHLFDGGIPSASFVSEEVQRCDVNDNIRWMVNG